MHFVGSATMRVSAWILSARKKRGPQDDKLLDDKLLKDVFGKPVLLDLYQFVFRGNSRGFR